jgi:putative phage-type endonuclease
MRQRFVTASEVAVILGLSPYKTPRQLLHEKWFGAVTIDNRHVRRGIENEPVILDVWAKQHDARYRRGKYLYQCSDYSWLAATPDAIARVRGESVVVEIKCPSRPWPVLPEYYVVQVKTQMLVLGIPRAYLVAGFERDLTRPRQWPIELRATDVDLIVSRTKKFYEHMLQSEVPDEYYNARTLASSAV